MVLAMGNFANNGINQYLLDILSIILLEIPFGTRNQNTVQKLQTFAPHQFDIAVKSFRQKVCSTAKMKMHTLILKFMKVVVLLQQVTLAKQSKVLRDIGMNMRILIKNLSELNTRGTFLITNLIGKYFSLYFYHEITQYLGII